MKNIRSLFCIIFILFFTGLVRSQAEQDDVVYLNNGTFLRGKIVEQVQDGSLKILVAGKDTLVIRMADVKMIKKEDAPYDPDLHYEKGVKSFGYTIIPELTVGWGVSESINHNGEFPDKEFSTLVSVFNGITIDPLIDLGIGVGVEIWKNRIFTPVYFDLRFNFMKNTSTPFLFCNLGYSPGWVKDEKGGGLGGAMAGIGGGAKISISRNAALVIGLGYRFQQIKDWQVNGTVETKATHDAHFFDLKVGVVL